MKLTDVFKTKSFKDKVQAEAKILAEAIIKEQGLLSPEAIADKYVEKGEIDKLQAIINEKDQVINDFEIEVGEEIDPAEAGAKEIAGAV